MTSASACRGSRPSKRSRIRSAMTDDRTDRSPSQACWCARRAVALGPAQVFRAGFGYCLLFVPIAERFTRAGKKPNDRGLAVRSGEGSHDANLVAFRVVDDFRRELGADAEHLQIARGRIDDLMRRLGASRRTGNEIILFDRISLAADAKLTLTFEHEK